MAQIGLSEASRLVGKNQSTIHRAMKTGRLSYTTDQAGDRQIDTAELDRVFGIKVDRSNGATGPNGASLGVHAQPVQSKIAHEPEGERIIAAQALTIAQQDATIADLRARLDHEVEERRHLLALLTGPRRPWWRRWFR